MGELNEMDIDLAIAFIKHRFDREENDLIFRRWIASPFYQSMSFNDFKKELQPKEMRSDEEILAEVYEKFEKAGL